MSYKDAETQRLYKFCPVWLRSLFYLSAVCLWMSACLRVSQPTVQTVAATLQYADFPAGVGRGYPLVNLDGLEPAPTELKKGDLPPNFYLRLEDGRQLSLHDLQGKPVLINFWATWCGPCRLEMPEIVRTAAQHEDLIVLAVNVQEALEQIQPFAEHFQMDLLILQDQDGELRKRYQVRGMPTSVFVDREGKIAEVWPGLLTRKLLAEFLRQL